MHEVAALCTALPSDSSALQASISALRNSISALDSSIKTLEGASAPWERLAILSSFAVGFGIVGEVVVIVSEYFDDLHDWSRGRSFWLWRTVLPPERPPRWRFWFDIIATVIVLAGVLGEAWASKQLASINSQLRSDTNLLRADSDQLLAMVTEVAGAAVADALSAKTAAGQAGTAASSALERAERARDDLAILEAYVRKFQIPRSLPKPYPSTPDTLRGRAFQRIRGVGMLVIIEPESGNSEAKDLAVQIDDLLKNAGWNSRISESFPRGRRMPPGVTLITKDSTVAGITPTARPIAKPPRSSTVLASALLSLLEIDLGPNDENPSHGVFQTLDPNDGASSRIESMYGLGMQGFPTEGIVILVGGQPFLDPLSVLSDSQTHGPKQGKNSDTRAKP